MTAATALSIALAAATLAAATLAACGSPGAAPAVRVSRHDVPRSRQVTHDVPRSRQVTHDVLRYRYMTDVADGRRTRRYAYNLVDVGPDRGVIDALPAGQRALVWIGDYGKESCSFSRSDANIRQVLAGLARDPKVAGYYIADEADDTRPAYGGHCPHVVAQVTARSRLVHRLAPGAFTYQVVTEPGNFAAFATATDVLGADPYPCLRGGACDWSQIPRYVAALRAAHVARYWGVLQAFSGDRWRYPTPAELLAMIRQWQHSDWQGEQTFAWRFAGHSLIRHPGLLAVLRALNRGSIRPAAAVSAHPRPGRSYSRRSTPTSDAGWPGRQGVVEFAPSASLPHSEMPASLAGWGIR